jgi:hypothetical protein
MKKLAPPPKAQMSSFMLWMRSQLITFAKNIAIGGTEEQKKHLLRWYEDASKLYRNKSDYISTNCPSRANKHQACLEKTSSTKENSAEHEVINTKQVILLRFVEPASRTTFCL